MKGRALRNTPTCQKMLWDILCLNVCHFAGQGETVNVACIPWTYTKPKVKAVITWTDSLLIQNITTITGIPIPQVLQLVQNSAFTF